VEAHEKTPGLVKSYSRNLHGLSLQACQQKWDGTRRMRPTATRKRGTRVAATCAASPSVVNVGTRWDARCKVTTLYHARAPSGTADVGLRRCISPRPKLSVIGDVQRAERQRVS
jgi:hypothetical protein